MEHEFWVYLSKSWGLLYLVVFSLAILAYTLRPSNQKTFDKAAQSILDEDDKPCR
ncbi:MAG: cbb3-type cytochrome oxidase subunit 3 [Granulosicoccus sp.]